MPLPPLVRRLFEVRLAAWCRDRVPEHVRPELRLEYEVDGRAATLSEVRPAWDGRPGETRSPFARIRYEKKRFLLYCRDRHGKWHRFEPFPPSPDLDAVLREIEADRTGIFFG